jgi:hypothetical protein
MTLGDILRAQFQLSLARAAYWTAFATTPANLARDVRQGGSDGPRLTRDQLIDSAMQTAANHLSNAQQTLDAMNEIAATAASEPLLPR